MFESIPQITDDPILSITARYMADNNPQKIDLGVGVFRDDTGKTPILESVKLAEQAFMKQQSSKSYIGSGGVQLFIEEAEQLIFGSENIAKYRDSITSVQSLSGTGALYLSGNLIQLLPEFENKTAWISSPTWPNHKQIFQFLGFTIRNYGYFDQISNQIDFEAMISSLKSANSGDFVIFHASCHNPIGLDLDYKKWLTIAELCREKNLLPIIDNAYHGYANEIEMDRDAINAFLKKVDSFIVCYSFSKNFSIYRERIGVISVYDKESESELINKNLCNIARRTYSMPPSFSAESIALLLKSDELRSLWHSELTYMRNRLKKLRKVLTNELEPIFPKLTNIRNGNGMFSILGISTEKVQKLISDYSIYLPSSSRINIAGLRDKNIDYFVQSLKSVY